MITSARRPAIRVEHHLSAWNRTETEHNGLCWACHWPPFCADRYVIFGLFYVILSAAAAGTAGQSRGVPSGGERRAAMAVTYRARRRRRVGLVLGAGGVLGAAWMAGALRPVQERIGRPLHEVELIVGTSAGGVLASVLRCGVSVDDIVAHQRGDGPPILPHLGELDRESGVLPPMPRLRLGSPRLLASSVRAPHRVHPWVAASALLPEGRARHHTLGRLVQTLVTHSHHHLELRDPAWPRRQTWIMAVDYESGRRVGFGRPGAPAASLPDAVVASCSIPGWYEPKIIGKRRYVDGGVRSSTSLDLVARADLDDVYVLAPMANYAPRTPRHPALRAERFVRQLITRAMAREVRTLRASGATVTVITPGPEDLAAMGPNLMDHARRRRVLEQSLATSRERLMTDDGGLWAA
jgi:NTE family protein